MPGQLTISGLSRSVEAGATIGIVNAATSEALVVTADETGAFNLAMGGNVGDILSITIYDNSGNTSETTRYKVGAIQIIDPVANGSVDDNVVNIYGVVDDTINSNIVVNGEPACVAGNKFYINHLKLQQGNNDISAVLTLPDGIKSSHLIQYSSTASSKIDIDISNYCGVAPLRTMFEIADNSGNSSAYTINVDYEGDGENDETLYSLASFEHIYDLPGLSTPEIEVEIDGNIYTRWFYSIVLDEAELKAVLESIWANVTTALSAGDVNGALSSMSTDMHYFYQPIFEALLPHMSEIVAGWSGIEPLTISNSYASYAVLRVMNNQPRVFIVNFKRDRNGIWKLESF